MTTVYPRPERPVFDPRLESAEQAGSPLRRLPLWPDRLVAYVESRRTMPFAWGPHDCFTFVTGAIEAITGTALYPATWTDALSAVREIEKHGSYEAMISSVLGPPSQNWREARRGDVVLAEAEEGTRRAAIWRRPSMLCLGATLCGPGVDGLAFKPLTDAVTVWRVG